MGREGRHLLLASGGDRGVRMFPLVGFFCRVNFVLLRS